MSYQNSGFKSSSFHSDFGNSFAISAIESVLPNYQQFPKGPATTGELTDMYCLSRTNESFAEFVKQVIILQRHTEAFMASIDKDYCAMVIGLQAVPELDEIKTLFSQGYSSKQITDFYTSKMVIRKQI